MITVSSPLGDGALEFSHMRGREELGRLFQFELDLFSTDHQIQPDQILGQNLTVRAEFPGGTVRHFNGFVSWFCHTSRADDAFAWYRVILRPWLWFLTRTADCRIFQETTVEGILKELFSEHGLTDVQYVLSRDYRQREYCVQYRETDFDFVSRLMEEEGIYYYFRHEPGKHTLVLADSVSAHSPFSGYEKIPYLPGDSQQHYARDFIDDWSVSQQVQPGSWALNDFDFERPRADLHTKTSIRRAHAQAEYEMFDYPGSYVQADHGETYSRVRIEELQAQYEQVQASGNAAGLATGCLFKLVDHPRQDQNREYLIVSASYDLSVTTELGTAEEEAGAHLSCPFTAIDSQQPYRSARITPRPAVPGPQTAIVVGKEGEEIWTDKYGRVKIQFHWDRYGERDENSSCWVRVAQLWAGKTWGAMHIPRIGQEVVVEFIDGDLDRPLITGRVYNGESMPPYGLPDNQTQSGLKSRSTKDGDGETFNELRFEDKKDHEQIYFHAEKDFHRVVENNDTLQVGFDKKDHGDQTIEIHNNQSLTVGNQDSDDGSQTITIWNNRTTTLKEGHETLTVEKGDRTVSLDKGNDTHHIKTGDRDVKIDKGNDTLAIKTGNRDVNIDKGGDTLTIKMGNQTVKLNTGKSTTEAAQGIELKVGGSSIKITATMITLKAQIIKLEAMGMLQGKGGFTSLKGNALLEINGGLVKIN